VTTSRGRLGAIGALLGLALATLAGCGSDAQSAPEPTPVPGAATNGRMTIGIAFDEPGIGVKDGDTYTGFDVETAKYVAKALGVPEENITWVEATGAKREELLASGGADMIVSTYTINDERKQKVDFAGPYYVAGQDIMVAADNTDITGKESLDGKTVCTATGSTPERRLREETKAEVVTFDTYSECAEALRDGRVEAVSTDNVILLGLIQESGDEFKLVGAPFSEEPYGIGLKLGADDLRSFINDVLEQSFEDGSWAAAYEATVGQVDENTPEPPAVDRY